jgi:hypothetical protein
MKTAFNVFTGNFDIVGTSGGGGGNSNVFDLIMGAPDRIALFTYADFGTKNQRVTNINYSSATYASFTVNRDFAYTLVGNRYRRDSETWSLDLV